MLLDGSLDLRVRHLLALAEILSVPPEDLLAFTLRDAREKAKHRITDCLPHLRPREEGQPLALLSSAGEVRSRKREGLS
jgi:hypothetical protein